jgi:hypothetical protein
MHQYTLLPACRKSCSRSLRTERGTRFHPRAHQLHFLLSPLHRRGLTQNLDQRVCTCTCFGFAHLFFCFAFVSYVPRTSHLESQLCLTVALLTKLMFVAVHLIGDFDLSLLFAHAFAQNIYITALKIPTATLEEMRLALTYQVEVFACIHIIDY